MPSLRQVGLGIGKGAAWAAVAALAVLLSVWAHLAQADGRHRLGQALAGYATKSIPGRVELDRLVTVTADRVVVHGAVLREPDADTEVLSLDHVEADPDVRAFLRSGDIRIRAVRVRGARVWIKKPAEGRIGLVRAMSEPGGEGRGPDAPEIELAPIHLSDARADFELGDKKFTIRGVQGFVTVRIGDDERIRFDRLGGVFHPPGGPVDEVPFRGLSGRVHPAAEKLLAVKATLQVLDDSVGAEILYFDRPDPPNVAIHLETDGLSAASLAVLGFGGVAKLLPAVEGTLDLSGSVDQGLQLSPRQRERLELDERD
ncbi:MAG: hypothetical protein ACOCV4_02655 [Myxococcota bacterium]